MRGEQVHYLQPRQIAAMQEDLRLVRGATAAAGAAVVAAAA